MNHKPMTVHEVAGLTGITIRTLHYYDEIDLLKPTIVTNAKYRLYTDNDLNRLQEILFFREIGFALKEIKHLMNSPNYNRTEALKKHLDILVAQRERINALIDLVRSRINGENAITFSAFSNTKVLELQAQFREEILDRWGDTDIFKEFEEMFSSKARKQQNEQMDTLYDMAYSTFEKLAVYENDKPDCHEVQEIVQEWQNYISEHFYKCDKERLSYLSQLYVTDERFSDFINGFGNSDLAAFFSKAIEIFCKK